MALKDKKQEALDKTRSRVGRSLLKYFNPIRIASTEAHIIKNFKSKFGPKKENQKVDNLTETQVADKLTESSNSIVSSPVPPPNSNWLNVVVYLLDTCKNVTKKMGKKLAFQSYKHVLDTSMKQKMKIVGSIVNTSSEVAEEKALAKIELERAKKEEHAIALAQLLAEETEEAAKYKKKSA